ncbi:MAG: M3 family metallopeptidase [Planctomycetaceae bacterium]
MTQNANPLLRTTGLPAFDEIKPEHVVPAVRSILEDATTKLEEFEKTAQPTWDGLVKPMEAMDIPFDYGWGPVTHLFGVMNSDELREAYEEVLGDVVAFSLRFSQSKPIYDMLCKLRDGDSWDSLDEAQQRIVDAKILGMTLSGIGLEGEQQDRFNEIAKEMSQLSTDFSNHVLDATRAYGLVVKDVAETEGMPESLRAMASANYNEKREEGQPESTAEAGPWRFTLDGPCFIAFMDHCRNPKLREEVYRAYLTRASDGELDNTPLITKVLKLRKEKAQLLGFDDYGAMSLAKKMAPSVKDVQDMLQRLRASSWDAANKDHEEITAFANENGHEGPLRHWDIAFWSERLREQRYEYTDEEVRPYFALDRVLDGLSGLLERLFGVKLVATENEAPVWHSDVRFYYIEDSNGDRIAALYLDPYSRPETKRPGAWMDDCLARCVIDGEVRIPVAHLVCNSTPPVGDKPSLMTFREVETLFHEFGHGLQHMLTTVNYRDAAGISGVEWDAVELPSQFMENWCYHKPTLIGMTAHFETGEPLPDELFEKICAARTYRAGSGMMRQLLFGLIDLELHTNFDPDGEETPFDVQRRIAKTTSLLQPLPEDRFLCAFSHIFAGGYAAGYYSYKWAEVLSADAFAAFEEVGLDNESAVQETGRRFRDTVLSLGGGRHPMDIFKDFRGREPEVDALLRHSGLA